MVTPNPAQATAYALGYEDRAAGKPYMNPFEPPKPTTVREVLATVNVKGTLSPVDAESALTLVLEFGSRVGSGSSPDVVALQEWGGRPRSDILRKLGTLTVFPTMRRWNPLLKTRKTTAGWLFARPVVGRSMGFDASRYEVRFVKSRVLVGPGKVDRVPGYKTYLGPSVASVFIVRDHTTGEDEVFVNYHLTTHVQNKTGQYRPECPLRVARHKAERRGLEEIREYHEKRGRRVYFLGDGNFDGMTIPGLVNVWTGVPASVGGTHGSRRIDLIHAPTKADSVVIVRTKSDHGHPVATYTKPVPA